MGEQIEPPIFDYNMLLGIILFYIKCVLQSPGLVRWLEGPALHRSLGSFTHTHSEPRLGKQGENQSKSFKLSPVQSFCDLGGHV